MTGAGLWISTWSVVLNLPEGLPAWVIAACALVVIFCFVVIPSAMIVSYLDRKISADFQARVGPNRAGPGGVFQAVADVAKLLQKERFSRWSFSEEAWLAIHTMALYSTVAVLPLGSLSLMVDTDMSALLPFWAALVLGFGTMLLGLSQHSVAGWLGGMRVAAQALSGAFPALVAVVTAAIRAGSFRWSGLVAAQGAGPLHWAAMSNPFQFFAFVVFVVAGLVLLGIAPMDAGLMAGDLRGGVAAHLSGRRLVLFRLGRFYGFFLWSTIASVLFLGGWHLPFGLYETLMDDGQVPLVLVLEILTVLSKTLGLMLLVTWVARVNPRTRVDQVTDFSWKVLSPFALFALIGATIWVGIGGMI